MVGQVSDRLFLDYEIGRAVLDISDFRIDDGQAAAGIVADPQAVPGVRPDSIIGNVYVFQADIGKRALTVLAARSDNAQSVGEAVIDVHVADVHARNAAAVHAKLKCRPPSPIVIISTAADQVAIPYHGRSAEVVIDFSAFVGSWKSRADQNAAPGGNIAKKAVFDTVVRAAIDRAAVGEEWQLTRAVTKNVVAGQKCSLHEALIGRRRPHGKAIIARIAGGAILDC